MNLRSLFFTCALGLLFASCADDNGTEPTIPAGNGQDDATAIKLVVPSGTRSVTVEYPTADGYGSISVPVTIAASHSERYGTSAITNGEISLSALVPTTVNIYDEQGNILALNVPVSETGNPTATDATMLPEDAVENYVTADANQTFYHSSGVAMFDDSWPYTYTNDEDFNDVVIDYDIETKTVDMNVIPDQAWREQIKVVMHLRSLGGNYPQSAGLYLESLDNKYVKDYTATLTLGNDNAADAEKMGVTYDVDMNGEHPIITFNNLQWLISEDAKTVTYNKNGQTWYMNPRDPEKLAINHNPLPYTDITANTFYNVNPGIVNTGGSLLTLTVIFTGTDRNSLTKEEGQKQIDHFINATMDINKQNFFIRCFSDKMGHDFEIHMKGYDPTPEYDRYDADNAEGVEKDNSTTYSGADGSIYGFKVPVLTRHAYEKKPFHKAYPEFQAWFINKGETNTDWYLHPDENNDYTCCYW